MPVLLRMLDPNSQVINITGFDNSTAVWGIVTESRQEKVSLVFRSLLNLLHIPS